MCFPQKNPRNPGAWVPRTIWEPPNSDILVLPSASASKPRSIDFQGTFVDPFERGFLLNSWLYIDIFIPHHLAGQDFVTHEQSLWKGRGDTFATWALGPIQMEFNSTTWFTGPPGTCATNHPWGCIYVCHSYVCFNDMKNHGSQNIPFPPLKKKSVCQSFLVPNQHREQEEGVALRNCCKATSFPGQRGLAEIGV